MTGYTSLRRLTVLRASSITPRMRRITLGAALHDLRTDAPDDVIRLCPAALPVLRYGSLHWGAEALYRPHTVRRFDAAAGELDVDIALHGAGVAADWARTAASGDVMHVAGPKDSRPWPAADCHILAGDETALPAIGRWLEQRDPRARFLAIVEVADRDEEQPLPITWLHRDGRAAGGDLLLDEVRQLEWPAGRVFVWAAGETNSMRRLSRHLRDRGLPRDMVRVRGYWSRG